MIKYWLKSKEGSVYYYNFMDIALEGILSIDENLNVQLVSAEGEFANNKRRIEKVLYIVKKKVEEFGFLEKFIYATH